MVSDHDLKERLLSKCVEVPGPLDTPCLVFMGARNVGGYGCVRVSGRTLQAHRVSYELFIASIPLDLHVLHRCDRPPCIEPSHLWLGSHQDNMRDMAAKHRNFTFVNGKGEACASAILTEREAGEIKFLALEGWLTQKEIAEMYSISQSHVKDIKLGHRWRDLEPVEPPPPNIHAAVWPDRRINY